MRIPHQSRRWLAGAYLLVALIATWQRGIASREHTTFAIFRQSFVHLVEHRDLYARYPTEQGTEARDRFKYSPSAAVVLAPLAALPYGLAMLVWNLLNCGLLFLAVARLLPGRRGDVALACLLPELFASIQSQSSNGLIAALMLLALGWILDGRHGRAVLAIAIGTAMKVFPLAIAAVAIAHPRRARFALALASVALVVFLLPLLVISGSELHQQYLSWRALELSDAMDIAFGMSLIRAIRDVSSTTLPNWAFQLGGTVMLLVALLRRDRWKEASFPLHFGCSVLLYAVLFNHQAERATFVIAASGAVIWLATRPRSIPLMAVFALALLGTSSMPYAALWIALQFELLTGAPALARPTWGAIAARRTAGVGEGTCLACGLLVSRMCVTCGRCRSVAPAWPLQRVPDLLACATLGLVLVDLTTPQHYVLPWNLWDVIR